MINRRFEHGRDGGLAAYGRHHEKVIYPALAVAILTFVLVIAVIARTSGDGEKLPATIRVPQTDLSDLDIVIDHVQSCSCWHGPRAQIQRKYKFRVTNQSDSVLHIGGGERSALRLLVAYPRSFRPHLTMPKEGTASYTANLSSPPDVAIPVTSESRAVLASHLEAVAGSNRYFNVPDTYDVWALPPTPNKLAEKVLASESGEGQDGASYPTVVDDTSLLPGEAYEGKLLGHGTWTFYIPIEPAFARSVDPVDTSIQLVLPREDYEPHVIFVGIAVFESHGSDTRLVGFAPAPSDDEFRHPANL